MPEIFELTFLTRIIKNINFMRIAPKLVKTLFFKTNDFLYFKCNFPYFFTKSLNIGIYNII